MFNSNILLAGLEGYRLVGRNGPRSRGPNNKIDRTVETLQARRLVRELKANKNRGGRLVGVLDLCLGESGMAMFAPVNGLMAAIDHTAIEHGLENLDIGSVMLVIQRQVGIVPIAEHAQTTETRLLELDILDSELVAELADLRHRGLIELGGTELLFDLVLNGLTMAVPSRDVGGLIALHGLIAVDDVLRDLVHGMTDVNRAVCIRRSIVQDELLVSLVLFQNLLIDLVVLPVLETLGLGLGKTGAHGKTGLGQVHGLFVLVGHEYPFRIHADALASFGHKKCARPYKLGRSALVRYSRSCSSFNHPA